MRAEIEISLQLKHENLIRVEDVFETKSHVFVIMEMMQGGELFDYVIEKSNLKESEASAIIKQVTSALKFMHSKGIIHRDLKPENVMLRNIPQKKGKRSKPFIKIIDFGMSKSLSPGRNAQSCLGTPGYMAPEVLEHKDYTSSVDMYSLGVVSYILLAGYMPLQTAEGQWHSRVIYPVEEWAEVSDEAKDFINQLVVYDPKKRMTAEKALAVRAYDSFALFRENIITNRVSHHFLCSYASDEDVSLSKYRSLLAASVVTQGKDKTRLDIDVVETSRKSIVEKRSSHTTLLGYARSRRRRSASGHCGG